VVDQRHHVEQVRIAGLWCRLDLDLVTLGLLGPSSTGQLGEAF
jgi:hypothetical protein